MMSMKTRFKTHAGALLSVFVLGTLYGALLNYCLTEIPMSTGPATSVEAAKIQASSTKPASPPVKVQDATNANPALGL
jgi:hypothetical protein